MGKTVSIGVSWTSDLHRNGECSHHRRLQHYPATYVQYQHCCQHYVEELLSFKTSANFAASGQSTSFDQPGPLTISVEASGGKQLGHSWHACSAWGPRCTPG